MEVDEIENMNPEISITASKFYKLVFERNHVQLEGLVEVSPEYPDKPPLFKLHFAKPPQLLATHSLANLPADSNLKKLINDKNSLSLALKPTEQPVDNNLKAIEIELNAYYDELKASYGEDMILTAQIKKLQVCFDVYMEIDRNGGELQQGGKMCVRALRGRDRKKPYVMTDLGLFDQRK